MVRRSPATGGHSSTPANPSSEDLCYSGADE
jgi:hypothetical protein